MSNKSYSKLPEMKLDHLLNLTDNTGLIQHSKFSTASKKEGYTTDDNARALSVSLLYNELYNDKIGKKLIDTYLSFLLFMQDESGKMHNFLGYNREILDEPTDEECMGRTILACGHCLNSKISIYKKAIAKEIIDKIFPFTLHFKSPRAIAQSIIGLVFYKKKYPKDENLSIRIHELSSKLTNHFNQQKSGKWTWFEPYLTYANGCLPQSLFYAYGSLGQKNWLKTASESLDFLMDIQTIDETFVPIGNKGWFIKGKDRALYDQQPIEASCMVDATLTAYEITKNKEYKKKAYEIFNWFLGRNLKKLMIYDPLTGGCHDGLTPEGVNMNQGAESTVSYLFARLRLEILKQV